MASSPVSTLEVLSGVTVQLIESTEPWTLDLDTLVVAVGPDGFGGLGRAIARMLPTGLVAGLPFKEITPERPFWYSLDAPVVLDRTLPLLSLILATAHDAQGRESVTSSSPPTIDAAAAGLVHALQLADQRGAAQVGATLLGTGVIGFDPGKVAAATMPQIRKLIVDGQVRHLQRIVLIAGDLRTRRAIADAWHPLAETDGGPLAALTELDRLLPQLRLSRTAADLLTQCFDLWVGERSVFPEGDERLVGEELLFQALLQFQATHQRPGVATALVRQLANASGEPDPHEVVRKVGVALEPGNSVFNVFVNRRHRAADAVPLVEQAVALAERTIGQPFVRQRHLLAAAVLSRPLIDPVREALGVDDAGLRRCLRAAIAEMLPTEAPSVWDEILLFSTEASTPRAVSDEPLQEHYSTTDLAGGYSTDLVDPERAIPAAEDLLGINAYVSMLANVVASADTPLPLSIGLFGEWGSGKSFFMGRLRQQVAELSTEDGYLSRIEQIGFNAWHYADTNLWASLGDEIFRQLARPRTDEQDAEIRKVEEARRTQLVDDLGKALSQQRELETATANAQRQATELRTQLDAARKDQGTAATVLLRSVAASDTLKKELHKAWIHLGVTDEVEQGELLARQIRGLDQDVDTFRRATRGRRGVGLAAVVVLSLLVLAAGAVASDAVRNWLVGSGLLGIAGGLAALTAFLGRVGTGARLLAKVATEAQEATDRDVSTKVREQLAALNRAEADAEILTTQLEEVRARAGEIGRQLADLAPGQRFYGFVADRAASQDYQSKLGLISTIRRDFEKLIDLMRDWREHPADHGNHQPIDRIVLYIDDLDRCSPNQVVEVLQAVHLLLALDLFVVVVGVDPRWLLHSLEQRYQDNFAAAAPADPLPQVESSAWDATPLNYLEKIFNIPFVLPGMTSDSFADLIGGWSAGTAGGLAQETAGPPSITQPADDTGTHDPVNGTGADAQVPATDALARSHLTLTDAEPVSPPAASGVAAEVPVEAGSVVDQMGRGYRTTPRPLSAAEVTHLRALAPLVLTPREAKRVFNLYRTIRASGNLSPASVFLGDEHTPGDFQAVIVLLGLLTAEPRLVGDLLWSPPDTKSGVAGGICHRPSNTTWSELLDGLAPQRSLSGDWGNDLGSLGSQPGSWQQVLPKVRQASALVTLPDLTAFQRWGPLVARFSFILSPLAAGAAHPAATQPTVPATISDFSSGPDGAKG